jgi:uncharacterized membrane protein
MGMTRTKERNGVFSCTRPPKIVVLGDRGIHERVGQHLGQQPVVSRNSSRGRFTGGLVRARKVGEQLATHFRSIPPPIKTNSPMMSTLATVAAVYDRRCGDLLDCLAVK